MQAIARDQATAERLLAGATRLGGNKLVCEESAPIVQTEPED